MSDVFPLLIIPYSLKNVWLHTLLKNLKRSSIIIQPAAAQIKISYKELSRSLFLKY